MSLIDRAITKRREEGTLSMIGSLMRYLYWNIRRSMFEPISFALWKLGFIDIQDMYGKKYYDKMVRKEAQEDAREFADIIINQYDPSRVVDLGCGVGRFLKPLSESGIEVYGIDGSQYAVNNPIDPNIKIEEHDLTKSLDIKKEADVVICLEVLEHLPKEAAQTAVDSISAAAPVAIVTTAPPGQGGKHHVNEQPLDYWIKKFEKSGMEYQNSATHMIKKSADPNELVWLEKNVAVFKNNRG